MINRLAVSGSIASIDKVKDEFARSTTADAFLIAMAATDPQNVKIVTYETSEPARRNKVKIPDAAASVGVQCVTLVEMMNELGVTF